MGEFLDQIQRYSVAEIVEALGCPRGTAYYWKQGKRRPPGWMEPIFLAVLKAKFPAPVGMRKPRSTGGRS